MAETVTSTTQNLGNGTTATAGVTSSTSLNTLAKDVKKLTGIDMTKIFSTPGTGTKTPPTPSALKLKCQFTYKLGLNLPSIPSIYLPKFPPKLPSIPIPTSIPLGPCTISIDLACLGIPSDLVQIAIKYIIIPIAGGLIPPKTEALIHVIAGKVASVIETAEDYKERYEEIQHILNNLALDAMFGLDAIPCPDQVKKAKEKAAAEAEAAKKREAEGKLTREDIYNKYSEALKQVVNNYNKAGVTAKPVYSYVVSDRVVSYEITNKNALAELDDAKKTEILKPLTEWQSKYETPTS